MNKVLHVHKFYLGNWKVGVFFKLWYAKIDYMLGWSSKIPTTNRQVIFWDFKTPIDYLTLRFTLRSLQYCNSLGNIYIFKSGNKESYRAICLDSVCTDMSLRFIASMYQHVDLAFLQKCLDRKYAILRLSPKGDQPNIFYDFLYRHNNNLSSKSHALVLKTLYDCPLPNNLDNSDVRLTQYEPYETIVR